MSSTEVLLATLLVLHAATVARDHVASAAATVAHAATAAEDTSTALAVTHATTVADVASPALLVLHAAAVRGTALGGILLVVCTTALLIAHAQVLLPALLAFLALLQPCTTELGSPFAPGEVMLSAALVLHAATVPGSTASTIPLQCLGTGSTTALEPASPALLVAHAATVSTHGG